MGFLLGLAAMKGLRKKKKVRSKAVEFEGIISGRRRVMVKPNLKLACVENIPDDLLMDILARLPAKVVTSLILVSKLWYSLIFSSHFRNRFLASPPSAKPMRFIMSLVGQKNQCHHAFLSSSLPHDDQSDWFVSKLDQVLDLPGMFGYLVNALRGLLCVRLGRQVRILNLTTEQRVDLPFIKSRLLAGPNNDIWTSFGYDSVHNEYKVFNIVSVVSGEEKIVRSIHQVLVLGPKASWRNTKGHTCPPHRPYGKGRFINGVLYYGVFLDQNKCAIMSFDFTSEDFKLIELPIGFSNIPHTNCGNVMNYKDKIAVFDHDAKFMGRENMSIDFWVMEDVKKMEWTKHTMILPLYQMGFSCLNRVGMQGTSSSCEVLLGVTNPIMGLPILYVHFDLEKNKITKRLVIILPDHLQGFFGEVGWQQNLWEDDIENIMYLET